MASTHPGRYSLETVSLYSKHTPRQRRFEACSMLVDSHCNRVYCEQMRGNGCEHTLPNFDIYAAVSSMILKCDRTVCRTPRWRRKIL